MKVRFSTSCFFACLIGLTACEPAADPAGGDGGSPSPATPAAGSQNPTGSALADEPIEAYQRELLKLAFAAASKFPLSPHHKNRGRAQQLVTDAAFALGQANLALSFAPEIKNWRRGTVYADYAFHAARGGATARVGRYIELAKAVIEEQAQDDKAQAWRGDMIRLKLARAHAALGSKAEARAMSAAISDVSTDAVDETWAQATASRAADMPLAEARKEFERLDQAFLGNTDSLGNQFSSLILLAQMHDVHFAAGELRASIEDRLLTTYNKLPPELRLKAGAMLVDNCLEHGDEAAAKKLVEAMMEVYRSATWSPRYGIPQLAKIIQKRVAVGDVDRARAELTKLQEQYYAQREQIANMWRAETLRPVAITWHRLGDADQAMGLLEIALEEGMENPNARPRCFDLVETCADMARERMQPSDSLMQRLREISDQLKDPW